MTTAWNDLADLGSYNRLPVAQRLDLARRLATTLGGDYSPAPGLVGRANLAAVQHNPTGITFLAVPGGSFQMGITDAERDEILGLVEGQRGPVERQLVYARPPHAVLVQPFLCARAPLLESAARAVVGSRDKAHRPDFYAETAPVPAHLTRAETARALARMPGWRLISEAEWEYVAREGGTSSWLCERLTSSRAEPVRAAQALTENASYAEGAPNPLAVNAFGAWGLLLGEWVADGWHESYEGAPSYSAAWAPGAEPCVARAGAGVLWPWQDDMTFVLCHAAVRHNARHTATVWGVRFAMDLPPA